MNDNSMRTSYQIFKGCLKTLQPPEDSIVSSMHLSSFVSCSYDSQPHSFNDPFDDPEMEPLPLGPGIVDSNCGLQHHALPSVRPMDAHSFESLMTLHSSGTRHSMMESSVFITTNEDDPAQILSSILDPVMDFAAGSKRSFSSPSQQMEELLKPKKRQKLCHHDRHCENADEERVARFRPYQENQWRIQFLKLMEFKSQTGHCCVPHSYPEDTVLARWVKRQRYQYKKLNDNDPTSTMTILRMEELESVGFVWHCHAAAWLEKLNELKTFKESTGHCNVPSHFPENAQLSTWMKCQRRQYKLYISGASSSMTVERVQVLESLGFVFDIRKNKGAKKISSR